MKVLRRHRAADQPEVTRGMNHLITVTCIDYIDTDDKKKVFFNDISVEYLLVQSCTSLWDTFSYLWNILFSGHDIIEQTRRLLKWKIWKFEVSIKLLIFTYLLPLFKCKHVFSFNNALMKKKKKLLPLIILEFNITNNIIKNHATIFNMPTNLFDEKK